MGQTADKAYGDFAASDGLTNPFIVQQEPQHPHKITDRVKGGKTKRWADTEMCGGRKHSERLFCAYNLFGPLWHAANIMLSR